MGSLENIRNDVANSSFTINEINEINEAICDGIKQRYKVENLYFTYEYYGSDGYGCFLNGFNSILCSLRCSTTKSTTNKVLDPYTLDAVLNNLSENKEKIYFSDLRKYYNNLDDLRRDLLVINLSGI